MNYMRRSLNVHTMYRNKWNNTPVPVFASGYLLDIVFPSVSRSVPYKLRKYLRDFFVAYNDFVAQVGHINQFTDKMKMLYDKFKDLVFLPLDFRPSYAYNWHDLTVILHDLFLKIENFLYTSFDVELIKSLDMKRSLFLSKLAAVSPEVDLRAKAYVVKKRFNRSRAVEKL